MKIFKLTVLVFLASFVTVQAQDSLYLFQSNGGIIQYDLSQLDSMTFSSPQVTTSSTKVDSVGSIVDIDGNVYPTIKIGKQYWVFQWR